MAVVAASPFIFLSTKTMLYPNAIAFFSAACKAILLLPMILFCTCLKITSPGFGVSFTNPSTPSLICFKMDADNLLVKAYFSTMFLTSVKLLLSGTVGPLAITDKSSPGTSEIINENQLAAGACCNNWPPLIADRCLRMVFISSIFAPHCNNMLKVCCTSVSVALGGISIQSEDAPPLSRQITISFLPARCTTSMVLIVALMPASSGKGCAASMQMIFCSGSACSYLVTTIPAVIRLPKISSATLAMAALAFPAPII